MCTLQLRRQLGDGGLQLSAATQHTPLIKHTAAIAMVASVTPADENVSMMKAAYVNQWCAVGTVADSISFGEVPAPAAPKKAEVVVSVKAASISGDDVGLLQDTFAGGTAHSRKPSVANPLVGGMDYAGVVLACGPDCTKIKVGDRVCGIMKPFEYQPGTWAEQTKAPERDVCRIDDDSISFVDAAAVAMGAFVDSSMLKLAAKAVSDGGRCLVVGASGALGTVMVQLLKKQKVHVTAVCSGNNAETVKKMGADEVIDYTAKPFGEQLAAADKFAVVFDFVGGIEVQKGAAPLLEPGGKYVTAVGRVKGWQFRKLTGGEFRAALGYMLRSSMCDCCGKYKWSLAQPYPPLTAKIWKAAVIESGARAAIAEEVPFAEEPIREALRRVSTHHAGGRLVINLERTS